MPFVVVIFLVIMVVGVPFLNLYNLQLMEQVALRMPPKKKLYIQSAINQLVLAGLALWAAYAAGITLAYGGDFSNQALIAGGCFVAAGFILSIVAARNEKMRDDNMGLDMLKPETGSERLLWVAVNLVASACEEIMFRGVLYFIFLKTSHNMYVAAVMSAVCFGFSHSIQGRAAILVTILFGLGLQYLAYINNGLLLPMAAHFAHNMLTTVIVTRQDRKAGANIQEDFFIDDSDNDAVPPA